MKKKALGFFAFCLYSLPYLFSQETGTVQFFIHPADAIVRINGALYTVSGQSEVTLSEGVHSLEIWAPKFSVFRDTIEVVAGENLRYLKGLNTLSPEFQAYRERLVRYDFQTFLNVTADVLVAGFNVGGTYFILRKDPAISKAKEMVELSAKNYANAITLEDAWVAAQQHAFHLFAFEKLRKNHNRKIAIGVPVMIVSYGATAYYIKKRLQRKRVKPAYEEQNPFVYSILNAEPGIAFSTNEVSFHLRIQF